MGRSISPTSCILFDNTVSVAFSIVTVVNKRSSYSSGSQSGAREHHIALLISDGALRHIYIL
jgi:hypothetical protein